MHNAAMTHMTESLAKILKALGDTNRLNILTSIGAEARSVSEIVRATGLSQTLVSFHLRALRETNVVTTKREGPFINYSLSDPALLAILEGLSKTTNSKGRTNDGKPKATLRSKTIRRRR